MRTPDISALGRSCERARAWLPALALAGAMALLASPACAQSAGEYHEAARFGGFDASAPSVYEKSSKASLTPGMFYEPTGFAVDVHEENDVYVADRTSSVESKPAHWRIQKLSPTARPGCTETESNPSGCHVLATTTFTLPGGLEEASMIAGLAVDHKSGQPAGRLYALVMGPAKAKAYHRHATQAQELLAWSTVPTAGGELVAAAGLKSDPLKSTGGVVSDEEQLEQGASPSEPSPLYDPQGLAIDHLSEEAGVEDPVVIEATNPKGVELTENLKTIMEAPNSQRLGIEGAQLFELEDKGETVVQQVATQASDLGARLKRWPSSAGESSDKEAPDARELAGELGPLGIFDSAGGSITILLNARLASADSPDHMTSADVIRLDSNLESPLVVNNAKEDPPGARERRAVMALDPGPFFTDPQVGHPEAARPPPFELGNAGPEATQLENGLYAADVHFEWENAIEQQENGDLPIWLSYDSRKWRMEASDKRIDVGIRLLQASSAEKISGAKGEAIVGTLGDETRGSPCDIGSEEAALAAGAGNTLWVLDRGPTANTLEEVSGLRPGREIIELAPGAPGMGETSGCPQPQPSSEQFSIEKCGQSVTKPAPQGSELVFDASSVRLTHGLPFAYEWTVEHEGKPVASEDRLLESQEHQAAIDYTPEEAGLYTVSLTLWNDYGPHPLEKAQVMVTSERTAPEARFSAEQVPGTQEVAFRSTGQSGNCQPDRYYRWNWGDGTSEEGTAPETTHAYAEPGAKEVTLEVVNSGWMTATSEKTTVIVNAPPPEPGPAPEPSPLTIGSPVAPRAPARPSAGPTLLSPRASFAHGVLSLRITCPLAKLSCAGSVQAETAALYPAARANAREKPKRSRLVLARASFSLAGGMTRTLTLHIAGRGAALLSALRRLPALVLVAAHDSAGDPGAATVHLTLALPAVSGHRARTSR